MIKGKEKEYINGHDLAQIDKQGRIVIPSSFRPVLRDEFYAYPDGRYPNGCLVLAPKKRFVEMIDKKSKRIEALRAEALKEMNEKLLAKLDNLKSALEYLLGSSKSLKMDSQGRVVLPESLLNIAGLEKGTRVIVTGMEDVVKLWNQETWNKFTMDVRVPYRFLLI